MKTDFLSIKNDFDIKKAIEYLRQGELVAIPTETVYGLAADAKNDIAIKKIFIAKGRPTNHPLIVHIESIERITDWAENIPQETYVLANHFWPGPLTILLKKKKNVSNFITGGLNTVAIRIPNNDTLRNIIKNLNTGLVAPSANPHTKLSATTGKQVFDSLNGKIAAVLDGGSCEVGIESTILSLVEETPRILRQGPITKTMLEKILQRNVENLQKHSVKIPGNMLKHYQPNTKSILLNAQEIKNYIQNSANSSKKTGFMYYSEINIPALKNHSIKLSDDPKIYSQMMYKTLYELDTMLCDEIIIEIPPKSELWDAVLDRLQKACY